MNSSTNEVKAVFEAQQSSNDQKERSRGIGIDMSSKAVTRRLDIVDELRELAQELANAKRLGPIDSET
jgi:hypothetical protein